LIKLTLATSPTRLVSPSSVILTVSPEIGELSTKNRLIVSTTDKFVLRNLLDKKMLLFAENSAIMIKKGDCRLFWQLSPTQNVVALGGNFESVNENT